MAILDHDASASLRMPRSQSRNMTEREAPVPRRTKLGSSCREWRHDGLRSTASHRTGTGLESGSEVEDVAYMRVRTRLLALVAAWACVTATATAGPGDIYSDFAQDGKLNCNHSRADLKAALRSGSINQYGDPYTAARLKLAVRRQLAGGCRANDSASAPSGTGAGITGNGSTDSGSTNPRSAAKRAGKAGNAGSSSQARSDATRHSASSTAGSSGNGEFVSKRVLIAGLLVAGLAIGGWLTRRGLASSD